MEAKDTVLSEEAISRWGADDISLPKAGQPIRLNISPILEKQAEISFPLGEKQGIQKVVEWIDYNIIIADDKDRQAWRDRVRKWNIKIKA